MIKEIALSEPVRGWGLVLKKGVFGKPSRGLGLLWLTGALVLSSQYVYYWTLGGSPPIFTIIFSVGLALSGIAECLPKNRRRTAGMFRITAILVLVGLIVGAFFGLEFLI
ncbi:hypothetical protein C437_07542 [Haloarcula vallismortis ATCC 29715]|uniref:Uncharacterized protein n=1 Tax=Haloarcula vallismortis ATCC 29715 TaxID=662477 RepID=M0JMD5_HALVA|nr:hypothetical protein C437_07542 [Haloarcula vallismortis ATCC 29715]